MDGPPPLFTVIPFLQKLAPETLPPPRCWWLGGWVAGWLGGWVAGGWWLVAGLAGKVAG